ncbi:MAG TPA: DUF899 domain-containing protein [Lacunisphaera sp.]|jgi:predicted dithiol-disulfide oxidoreductase (DUF899 family)|nr:DUF899 domain-containing protein [Lacunisphaera sp.]
MSSSEINYPRAVTRGEWLEARRALLEREKALTRERDRLNTARRELPMVRVEQDYVFAGPDGPRPLRDLFAGRLQLIVYHFMWHWDKGQPLDTPCAGCSGWADQLSRGIFNGLHSRNTTLVLVSRAPLEKILPFKQRMGWTVPWYSSAGSSFNYDFNVTIDESIAPVVYNYRTRAEHEKAGTAYYLGGNQPFDLPGMSCFLRKGDEVYHTYSTYGRGGETTGGSYYFLDLTALGRQEDWEEPKGRSAGKGLPPRPDLNPYPDEYPA